MSTVTLAYRFTARGGLAADVIALNETPLRREIVVELDTQKFKVGDGTTTYTALPYWGGGGGGGGGSTWYTGVGAPAGGLGSDGDFYLRSSNGDFYQKVAGTWTVQGNLTGPPGADGPAGGPTIVLHTSGSFPLSAALHGGRMLLQDTGVITCPETVAAGFAVNDIVEVRRDTVGDVSFIGGGAAVLDFNTSLYVPTILFHKDTVGLKVVAVDTWAIIGPLKGT